jgi:hypothetical protein
VRCIFETVRPWHSWNLISTAIYTPWQDSLILPCTTKKEPASASYTRYINHAADSLFRALWSRTRPLSVHLLQCAFVILIPCRRYVPRPHSQWRDRRRLVVSYLVLLVENPGTKVLYRYVRQTTNFQSHGPVQDVTSSQIRCYELSPGTGAPKTQTVAAGDKVGFRVDPNIQHPGPLQFYLAKVPSGSKASSWAGDGNVWFKIYQDGPGFTSSGLTWPTQGSTQNNGPSTVNVTIPSCIAPGMSILLLSSVQELKAQPRGLPSSSRTHRSSLCRTTGRRSGNYHQVTDTLDLNMLMKSQFYISCGQLTVTGSGTKTFSGVAFPGAYKVSYPSYDHVTYILSGQI